MAAPVLKFKRGKLTELPSLAVGEPGFTTDKYDLYLGSSDGNKFVGSGRFWSTETATAGSGVRFFEATDNGAHSTLIQSSASLAASLTYVLPSAQGATSSVLTNDGSGNLSWSSGSLNPVFTGIATFNTTEVDINSAVDISGITTFSNTTDNTLGNVNTGAVQVDGGVGIAKNLTVGAAASVTSDFFVSGISTFVGAVTFQGGTINLGDADDDNIVLNGEINSNIIPNTDDAFDLGSSTKQWRHIFIDGIADVDDLNVSGIATITDLNVGGATTVTGALDVNGGADISGGETTLSSATVSDLTSGRIVLAGTSGALEDSALLTHTGGTGLVVTGNASVSGIATIKQLEVGLPGQTLVGITTILDEDGMGSNSDTALATQQSIKAYVDAQVTAQDLDFAGDSGTGAVDLDSQSLTIAGTSNEIETSASNQTITIGLPDTVNVTTAIDVPTIEVTDIKARDGSSAMTISNTTGNVSVASTLTVTGNLNVLGAQTIVNTETLKVEDSLIEVGLVNSGGDLVAPTTDADIDVGILFHYHTGSAAKKAAVFWDDSVSRIVFGSDVSETNSVLSATANTGYSGIEIKELYVNDCAGASQVISCTGSTRNLENITIDGGTFT